MRIRVLAASSGVRARPRPAGPPPWRRPGPCRWCRPAAPRTAWCRRCEAGVDRAPGRVDVEPDVLLGILTGQEEQLGHDHVGHLVVDGGADEDDPVLEQAGVDVHPALTPVGGLDDVGMSVIARPVYPRAVAGPSGGCEARTDPLRRSGVPRPDRLGQASEPSQSQGYC